MQFCSALLALLLAGQPCFAADGDDPPAVFRSGAIEISDPWAQASVGETHAALLFFEFRNRGTADAVVGASSPLAERVVMREGPREVGRIDLPANGEPFELNKPGYHLALESLRLPLTMGKTFPVTLRFRQGGEVTLTVTSRFHSPQLGRRIRDAVRRGDVGALKALAPADKGERQ